MAIGHAQVTVTTTPTLVISGDADGQHVLFKVIGTNDAYIGNGNVTTDNGFELEAGEAASPLFLGPGEELYAIVEVDDTKICYLATMNQ